jgi:hypothetical protein
VLCGGSGVKVEDPVESRDEKESASGRKNNRQSTVTTPPQGSSASQSPKYSTSKRISLFLLIVGPVSSSDFGSQLHSFSCSGPPSGTVSTPISTSCASFFRLFSSRHQWPHMNTTQIIGLKQIQIPATKCTSSLSQIC